MNTTAPQIPEQQCDPVGLPEWARRAKAVMPASIRHALKPLALKLFVKSAQNPAMDLSPCDRPIGNRHTIEVAGRKIRFFFLCGSWKSGTHWVSNLLNLHPKVCIRGEHHFEEIAICRRNLTTPTWYMAHHSPLLEVTNDAFESLVRRMLYVSTRNRPHAVWLGDHTPRLLNPVIRDAPHIHLVRDGRDVLISWAFHWLRVQNVNTFLPEFRHLAQRWCSEFMQNPDKFRDASIGLLGDDHWVRHTCRGWANFIREDSKAIPHFRSREVPIYEIRYEMLHTEVERIRTEMYHFLQIDPNDAEPISERTKTTPGFKSEQLQSHYRKGQVGDWRNYFDDRLRRIFKEEAGQALIDAGYEKDLNW